MINASAGKVFGLFELDLAGTLMYSKVDPNDSVALLPTLIGLNFFDEIAPFQNSVHLHRNTQLGG